MVNHRNATRGIAAGFLLAALCIPALPLAARQSPTQPTQGLAPASQADRPSNTSPRPDSNPSQEHNDEGRKGTRVFGLMPNNLTVEDATKITPISPGEKFKLVAEGVFDPFEFACVGLLAGIGQATDDNPSWGQGARGYGIRYASNFGDQMIGNFVVGAILPTVLRQDPRYFQSGKGSFWRRGRYALSRLVVTRGDSGATQFNASEIAGTGIAAAISNCYQPAAGRTFEETGQTWATQVGVDALTNELKEFWPDVRRKVFGKK